MPASIVHTEANQMGNQLDGRSNMDDIVAHTNFKLNIKIKQFKPKLLGLVFSPFSCGGAKMK